MKYSVLFIILLTSLLFGEELIKLGEYPNDTSDSLAYKSDVPKEEMDRWLIQLSANAVVADSISTKLGGGITMNYFLSDWFSFQYLMAGGKDYFEVSGSIVGLPLLLLLLGDIEQNSFTSFDDFKSDMFFLALFIIMSAENPSFHIPVSRKIDLNPSFSLFRVRYNYDPDSQKEDWQWTTSIGVALNCKVTEKTVLSPFGEYSNTGYNGGVRLGFTF